MLVTTISSQSRQETPVSKTDSNQHQDNEIPSIPADGFILVILFILLTGAMITPGILSPNPQNLFHCVSRRYHNILSPYDIPNQQELPIYHSKKMGSLYAAVQG